ncbi:MAG: glycerate kinase [Chloroflexota bacterium]|nr:glycerate kinase [Chloroflexota bacterium]
MRFVIAPQEFKGSLTASEAAEAIAAGVRDAVPDAEIDIAPMSDGGPGLVDAMVSARGGERVESPVHDPLMRPVRAGWAVLADGTAIIEMAASSGMVLLSPAERDPLAATTYGTGELILAALDRGCPQMVVGVGGSATVDAGAGALQALGVRLVDASGADLPPGGAHLLRLARIDLSCVDARLASVQLRVACDVTNRLCGPEGAAAMFGPQKGASVAAVELLDAALRCFGEIASRDADVDLLDIAGGGAAGGLAAGLMVLGAHIEPGFAIVAEGADLDARVRAADAVITGEGRLDGQTAFGKTAHGVAKLARAHAKPVAIVAGSVDAGYAAAVTGFDVIEQAMPPGMSVDEAMRDSKALVRSAATRAARRLRESAGY